MDTRRRAMRAALAAGILFLAIGFGAVEDARAGLADHLVINELQNDSTAATGGTDDDWVELFNPTAATLAVDGWTLQRFTATGITAVKVPLTGGIPAGGHLLVVGSDASAALKDIADIIAPASFLLSDDNSVFLVNDGVSIDPAAPGATVIDFVGYGATVRHEGASAAPAIPAGKSVARVPDGEDTNQNGTDLVVRDTATPQGLPAAPGDPIGGTVLLTVTPALTPVQGITANSAEIVFQLNAAGTASVRYGLTATYGSESTIEPVAAKTETVIALNGLACDTTYHYAIHAANAGATETDETVDATFATLPCGIRLDSLVMTKSGAKADNQYSTGWQWTYALTIWDMTETTLKMQFASWTGPDTIASAGNIRFSANGTDWASVTADNAYPAAGIAIGAIDRDTAAAGRQVLVTVEMRVPVGTLAGTYASSYGILTE